MAAFEFQIWTGRYSDTPKTLDELYSEALKLFFTSVDDLIDDGLPVNPLKPNNNWKSVASIAASMDYVDPKQESTLASSGQMPVSIYSLIVKALEMEPLVNQGVEVPRYVHRVLEWKQEAVYMLQLRHNYLSAMVLARMTPFEESFWFQLKQRYWGSSISLAQFSKPQFVEWTGWLKKGKETQDALKALGIAPEYTSCILESLQNLEMQSSPGLVSDAESEFLKQIVVYSEDYLN